MPGGLLSSFDTFSISSPRGPKTPHYLRFFALQPHRFFLSTSLNSLKRPVPCTLFNGRSLPFSLSLGFLLLSKTLSRVWDSDFGPLLVCNFTTITMVEKANKKHKKGFISEADISSLLQRYTANTVLALLQEVAQFPGVNLDWNALVKKTSTGISNAREYQMLWRHLAYRNALLEKLEDGAQPLDDDSDLEYELEAFPDVSSEASAEAAACVKVLIASGLQSDSNLPNSSTVEAPLTINIPNGQSFRSSPENSQPACLMQGMNITVPVSVQKLPLPTASTEVFGGNGSLSGNMSSRKKRKAWTREEDIELINAVKKYGEGNWANILRGDFKLDRTATQLSQRWTSLRKKRGNDITGANSSGSQLSEAQLAARHAMSLALDMPVKNTTAAPSTNNSAGAALNPTTNNSMLSTTTAEALPAGSSFVQHQSQSQQGPILTKSSLMESPVSAAKSRITSKKISTKSNFSTESSLRATAVAAGARIVTPASLLKVAQTKNAIHIMPSGVSSTKAPLTGSATAHSEASPSVHYIRTGLAAASPSSNSAVTSTAPQPISVKAASPRVQHNTSSEQTDAAISSPATELPLKSEVKAGEEIKVSDLCTTSGNEPSKEVDTAALPKPDLDLKNREAVAENPNSSMKMEVLENNQVQNSSSQAKANPKEDDKMMGSQVEGK